MKLIHIVIILHDLENLKEVKKVRGKNVQQEDTKLITQQKTVLCKVTQLSGIELFKMLIPKIDNIDAHVKTISVRYSQRRNKANLSLWSIVLVSLREFED